MNILKKQKIFVITITIILSLIIIIPLGFYGYIKYQFNSLKDETYAYLLEKYKKDEIEKIEMDFTVASYHYAAFVTFKDEPEHVYEYRMIDGKIRQGTPFPSKKDASKYKHLELDK